MTDSWYTVEEAQISATVLPVVNLVPDAESEIQISHNYS